MKQYEQPIREKLTLLIDNRAHGDAEEALACEDTVCEAAACITLHCLSRNRSAALRALCDTRGIHAGEEALDLEDFEKIRKWLALLPFGEAGKAGTLPVEPAYGGSSLIVITSSLTEELEAAVAEAESWFNAVTLVLVGEGRGAAGLIPTIRLPVGCNVADELVALE